MRKSELIAALQKIEGDPRVFVDIDGQLSDDVGPVCYPTNAQLIKNLHESNTTPAPELGERVIIV